MKSGNIKIGDIITVLGVPEGLEGETKSLFNLCIGRQFRVEDIIPVPELGSERFELYVGEVVGEPDYIHSIFIEKEFVTAATDASDTPTSGQDNIS